MNLGFAHSTAKMALGAALLTTCLMARINGPIAGVAGVPGEGDCTDCHSGTVNSGTGKLQIQLVDASTWTPGQQMRVRVTLTDPAARRWGFQITARSASSPTANAGTFALADASITRIETGLADSQYVEHNSAGTRLGTRDSSTWEVLWTPPAASFGPVTFYAAGNAANGDNTNSGDNIYTTSLTVSAAESKPPASYALSQFTFGGGWYAAIYLLNPNDSPANATLIFHGADGQPLDVPGAGATKTLALAPKGTGFVEVADGGPLTRGWVEVQLPDGVTGYCLLRQTVESRIYETVVPLAASSSREAVMLFDETSAATQVAVVNLGSDDILLTITARDTDGATIGASTAPLAAKNALAGPVNLLPGLEAIPGKRGSLALSATGPVSVSLIRVNGEAIAALPVVQR
jgi:Reeler domain